MSDNAMSIALMPINGTMTPPSPQINKLRRSKALAPTGRYTTPLSAMGINSGIMSALKITADKMADDAECRCMMSMALSHGSVEANKAGTMAKYLARSLAMENVV